jgi:uncharacterized protein (DUF433 family)
MGSGGRGRDHRGGGDVDAVEVNAGGETWTRIAGETLSMATEIAEADLLKRITVDPEIFGGKPIVRGRRLAVEHVLGMLAAGDSPEAILSGYPWLELADIHACLVYALRIVGHEVANGDQELKALADEWKQTRQKTSSSIVKLAMHPAYQRIIGKGRAAIPFILRELQKVPDHWFWALTSITGEDPVAEEDRGDLEAMARAWVTWGREHGYV